MNQRDSELIRDYLDGRISSSDLTELNVLLEGDAEARSRFRALATLEEGLRDLAEVPAIPRLNPVESTTQPSSIENGGRPDRRNSSITSGVFHRPLVAAAAGLLLGIFCTSAIWATTGSGRQKILTLIHESFEFGPSPEVTGVPHQPEIWSGDFSEVVAEQNQVSPKHGKQMLKFLRADHEGKEDPVGYVGDLYRVIDLHGHESALANDDALVSVEAAFGSIPLDEPDRFICGIGMYAMSNLPTATEGWKQLMEIENRLREESLANAHRWITLSPSGGQWQTGRAELRLPVESRYLIVVIHLSDRSAIQPDGEPPAVAFSGKFLDDVRVELSRRSSDF